MLHTLDRVWSPADVAILEFADQQWTHTGAKEAAIREQFDCSPTQYYAVLRRVLAQPEAEKWNAPLVHRLRRLNAARADLRSARRLA